MTFTQKETAIFWITSLIGSLAGLISDKQIMKAIEIYRLQYFSELTQRQTEDLIDEVKRHYRIDTVRLDNILQGGA